MNRDRLLRTVGLRFGGDADVGARLDVGERCRDQRHDADVVGHRNGEPGPVTRLDAERVAVDLFDLPAHPDALLLRQRGTCDRDNEARADQRPPPISGHDLPPPFAPLLNTC